MRKRPKIRHKRPGIVAGSILTISLSLLSVAALLTVNSGVLATMASFITGGGEESVPDISDIPDISDTDPAEPQTVESEPSADEPPVDIVFAKPSQLKGVWLKAGADYYWEESHNGETVRAQIDGAFEKIAEWGFNTVIVPVSVGGKMLFPYNDGQEIVIKDPDGSRFDPLNYILERARDRGVFTYGVIDLMVNSEGGPDPSTPDGAGAIRDMASRAVEHCPFDGWLIENPGYAFGKAGSFAEYMKTMPGGGFERFLKDSVTAVVIDVIKIIKKQSVNLYIGLLADGVWAHSTSDERGSQTSSVYESLTDGFADTRGWLIDGLFDFVMVKNPYSTEDKAAPFGKVVEWWAKLCKEISIPMYVAHDSAKVGSGEAGWKSPDQLARQVLACKNRQEWSGSAFTSFTALKNDTSGSTSAVVRAFKGTLNEKYISDKLIINTPAKTTITTYESKINIRGSADPNFDLLMNGKKVELSEHGFFSLDYNLQIGLNTFTFKHKGETVTYRITYRVVVLQSIQPTSSLSLDGGTVLIVSAVARKGSTVYAKIGSKKIEMKQVARQADEEEGKQESDYADYACEYKLPAGIINKAQNLGKITVYGSYKGLNETKAGGQITIKALPLPSPDDGKPMITGDDSPIDPGKGGKLLKTGKIITVTKNYAETFNGNTRDDWSRPNNAYLPKGTTDVVVDVVVEPVDGVITYYYLLGCGRRVYQKDVATFIKNGKITASKISGASVSVNTKVTTITLNSIWHVPYNLKLLPQKYRNENTQAYDISSFTADYVDIIFSYTTEVKDTPNVSSSPLFKSAEWIKGGDNTYTLRLHLRNKGVFYGYSVGWDKEKLVFAFKNPTVIQSENKPLTGKRIVIDPGHGGRSPGAEAGGVKEKELALNFSLLLRDKLAAKGATVIMTRTGDTLPDNLLNPPSLYARTNFARNNYTDLFISIHMNSFSRSGPRGYTIHYFNEYSYVLAKQIDVYAKLAYESSGGKSNRSETVCWDPFAVTRLHDCPAVLLECGFMSNTKDLEMLISEKYQQNLTTELANAFVAYFEAISDIAKITAVAPAPTTAPTEATATTFAPAGLIALARRRKRSGANSKTARVA